MSIDLRAERASIALIQELADLPTPDPTALRRRAARRRAATAAAVLTVLAGSVIGVGLGLRDVVNTQVTSDDRPASSTPTTRPEATATTSTSAPAAADASPARVPQRLERADHVVPLDATLSLDERVDGHPSIELRVLSAPPASCRWLITVVDWAMQGAVGPCYIPGSSSGIAFDPDLGPDIEVRVYAVTEGGTIVAETALVRFTLQ